MLVRAKCLLSCLGLSLALACGGGGTSGSPMPTPTPTSTPTPSSTPSPSPTPTPIQRNVNQALANSWGKATSTHRLTVGYLGGSITEGAGASSSTKNYRALTTAWLKTRLSGVAITEINAAVGGTGSELGAYRCGQDLLSKQPDLVFVEFAVNDYRGNADRIKIAMEGIVRQILTQNPSTDIVFIYTLNQKAASETYDKGLGLPSMDAHEAVALHYQIPSINVGRALWNTIQAGAGTWDSLTVDSTHPNDQGYAIYADAITPVLDAWLKQAAAQMAAPHTLPAPLTSNVLGKATLVDAWDLNAPGWTQENTSLANRFPHRIACNVPGTVLTYAFRGYAVGVYWLVAPDSGDIEWSLDGSAWATLSSWDTYALSYTRATSRGFGTLLLTSTDHVLQLRISATKNAQSTGTWIRIGALLVAQE